MNQRNFGKKALLLTTLLLSLSLTACSNRDFDRLLMDDEQKNQDAHANPFFWDSAQKLEGYDNLYELTPVGFLGKPYNAIRNYGDRLLVIGQGYSSNTTVGEELISEIEDATNWEGVKESFEDKLSKYQLSQTAEEDDSDWEVPEGDGQESDEYHDPEEGSGMDPGEFPDDTTLQYYFMVYDPWMNETVQTLSPGEIKCSDYQIVGNRLFLTDMETFSLSVYDKDLQLEKVYDISSFIKTHSMEFYGAQGDSFVYTCNNEHQLVQIDLTKEELIPVVIELPYSQIDIEGVTPDQKTMVLSAVDNNTLRYISPALSLEDLSTTATFYNNGYYWGGVTNQGIFTVYDNASHIWQYSTPKQELYYQGRDFYQCDPLEDQGFLGVLLDPNQEGVTNSYQYQYYNFEGQCLSGFEYDGNNVEAKTKNPRYLSPEYAFLPQCNSVFFVSYDISCHPSLLVWNLDEAGSIDTNLTVYTDVNQVEMAILESQGNPPPEPVSDFGLLTDCRAYADELEDQYGIQIYLGPEVPDSVDSYHTEQCLEPDQVQEALTKLSQELSLYPREFFQSLSYGNLYGMRIYLTGTIYGADETMVEQPSGFVNIIGNYNSMVLDASYCWDWDYVFHHEMSHLIDRKLEFRSYYLSDTLYSEDAWSRLNPDSFQYLYTYQDYEHSQGFQYYSSYFIDAYGTTFPTEDRAELFGNYMRSRILNTDCMIYDNSTLTNKLNFYLDCIEEGFHWDVRSDAS